MRKISIEDFNTTNMSVMAKIILVKHINDINALIHLYNTERSLQTLEDIKGLIPQNFKYNFLKNS